MGKNGIIEHEGIVKDVSKKSVMVGFIIQSSCDSCYAKGVCSIDQQQDEIIEIQNPTDSEYLIGEKVKILIKESLGLKAVLFAYLYPFLLVIISLFILVPIVDNETRAGILSLSFLLPYYLLLYIYRAKIKKEINFTLEKSIE